MASGKKNLNSLRKRIEDLLNIERSHMCWELGHFQAPTFIKEIGETPTKPHMLVCIDTASLAIMGNDLLRDSPSPQDLLTLLVVSMENPLLGRAIGGICGAAKALSVREKLAGAGISITGISGKQRSQQKGHPKSTEGGEFLHATRFLSSHGNV